MLLQSSLILCPNQRFKRIFEFVIACCEFFVFYPNLTTKKGTLFGVPFPCIVLNKKTISLALSNGCNYYNTSILPTSTALLSCCNDYSISLIIRSRYPSRFQSFNSLSINFNSQSLEN